ncbi:D-alanyl-lipoteichoic acid biosynthesis protein DltD [Verrucomicrobiota bacterium sgz303538]
MTPEGGTATVHIRAALLALVTAVIGLVASSARESHLERHYIHALAPQVLRVKDQGEVLQREAFAQPDILPLYGSSELVKPIPDKASVFFRKYPTSTLLPIDWTTAGFEREVMVPV